MAILFVYGRILRFLLFTHQSPPFSSRFNSHKITRIGRHKRSLARIRIVRSWKIAPNKYQNKAVPDRQLVSQLLTKERANASVNSRSNARFGQQKRTKNHKSVSFCCQCVWLDQMRRKGIRSNATSLNLSIFYQSRQIFLILQNISDGWTFHNNYFISIFKLHN